MCKVDSAVALFAIVLKEVAELGEELQGQLELAIKRV